MLQKLTQSWAFWAMLLLGGLLPITLEAHESHLSSPPEQGRQESPCPLCGQPWRGRVDLPITIPDKLPTPKNQLWISKLRKALSLEELAKAQYEADQKKFGLSNPYFHILPLTEQHITWMKKLFSAYGMTAEAKSYPVKTSGTILQALKSGRKLEAELATQFEWLLNKAEDKITKRLLNTMLTQTKMSLAMFQNDIRIIEIEGALVPSLL
jgi:hypothetical protein